LDEIARKTRRPRTSVYFHIRNTPLKEARKRLVREQTSRRVTAFNKSRRGKSFLNRHPIYFEYWNPAKAGLIGHLLFDGEITQRSCVYTNRNKVLLLQVEKAMRSIYPFPPKRATWNGVSKIFYHNVELAKYLKAKARLLLLEIRNQPISVQTAFLKSFFDDEGSVYFMRRRKAVRGYQHNLTILKLVKELLSIQNIEAKICSQGKEILISRKNDLKKFKERINFSRGVSINGKRKNSYWKQDLEKRSILRNLIESYR